MALLTRVSILARPKGRALPRLKIRAACDVLFQSSPAPRDGRYLGVAAGRQMKSCFNPRPPQGTGATARLEWRLKCHLFQSSPAPRDGRYGWCGDVCLLGRAVSILARPKGRALPIAGAGPYTVTLVSILARPKGRALLKGTRPRDVEISFQSSPAPRDGRYGLLMFIKRLAEVSILARPKGRALQIFK